MGVRPVTRLVVSLFDRLRCATATGDAPFPARPKTRTLFAALCLQERPIDRDELAARLWPDEPDAVARANLRRHAAYVERWLSTVTGAERPLRRTPGRLELDPSILEWVDVRAFRAAIAAGALDEAAALYTGDVLADCDDEWVVVERERLRSQYDDVLQDLVVAARARNEIERALRYARAARDRDPYDEAWLRTAMRIRYAAGDRAGALREYERHRTLLATELELEPMAETAMLARAIRELAPTGAAATLALEATAFVGRVREGRRLGEAIARERLVTVAGDAGAGKSRLSLRCARAFAEGLRDGAIVVDAARLVEPGGLERALARALDPGAPSQAGASLEELAARLEAVVVVDGCERQAAACADAARRLLAAGPSLRVVATSRVPLGVAGESIVRIGPLTPDDAVALFIERLGLARPRADPAVVDPSRVARICANLGGLPLAIELAAARARATSLERVLHDAGPSGATSGASLDVTFRASYETLSSTERAVLRRLAAFAKAWTVATGVAACAGVASAAGALAALGTLVERALVIPPAADAVVATYAMLDATRDFARSRARALGELDDDARAHARAIARRYVSIGPRLRAERAGDYYDELERDRDEIERALATLWNGDAAARDTATDLALAVSRFWADQGFARHGEAWLRRSLAEIGTRDPSKRLEILRVIGTITRDLGDYRRSYRDFAELAELLATHAGAIEVAKAQTMAANAARMTGDFAEALRRLSDARTAFAEHGERYHEAWSTYAIGTTLLSAGRFADARVELERATDAFNDLGAVSDSSSSIANLSLAHYYAGELAIAHELARESLARASACGHRYYYAHAALNEASILCALGRADDAWPRILEASAIAGELHAIDVLISCAETACAVLARSAPSETAVLLGSVDRARERAYAPRFPVDEPGYRALRDAAVAALGDDRFAALEARGRVTPLRLALADLPAIRVSAVTSAASR